MKGLSLLDPSAACVLLCSCCELSALHQRLAGGLDCSQTYRHRPIAGTQMLARTLQRRSLHVRSRAESLLTTNPCLPTRPILKHSRQLPCSGRLRSARLHHRISDPCSFCAPAFVQSAC
eukprot:6196974-Pleurochrysis_carterae.AAC.4